MGVLAGYLERHVLAPRLRDRGVKVWYDGAGEWIGWAQLKGGAEIREGEVEARTVQVGGLQVSLVTFTGSYYEVVRVAEELLEANEHPVLIYVAGEEPPEYLTPLRELECLSGVEERAELRHDLRRVARDAFRSNGLPDSEIDDLLESESVSFDFLERMQLGGSGGASPLQPIFGSGREEDVLPTFLGDGAKRDEVEREGLVDQVAELADRGIGLASYSYNVSDGASQASADRLAESLGRGLLVTELRQALSGMDPKEIAQVPSARTADQQQRASRICRRLRSDYPESYELLAVSVEEDLGLASAELDPLALEHVDTFPFEERRLLGICAERLQEGDPRQALTVAESSLRSFWASPERDPQRQAAWRACYDLATLAVAVEEVRQELQRPPKEADDWVQRYTQDSGWYRIDRLFRHVRSQLTSLLEGEQLEDAASTVFGAYHRLQETMAEGFVDAFQRAGWELTRLPGQTEVYRRFVRKRSAPVAYLHVDAMRYEMGAELAEVARQIGATDVDLQPVAAVAPTITDLGMVALLPGAERSFTMGERSNGGVTGVIDGSPLPTAAKRMEFAKGEVPALEEMPLEDLVHKLKRKELQQLVERASVLLIRSQEIDGAGESLRDSLAQSVMGSVLETVRQGIQRLAQAGVQEFVITADHGHLHLERRGEEMRIDPPEGGQEVDRHRRCWIGRGGSTPSACVRLSAGDLGYSGTDLELVTPRGLGVLKSGGSLSFHHGGLSLQEVVVPVLTFRLQRQDQQGGSKGGAQVTVSSLPQEITNMIFPLTVQRPDLPMDTLNIRVIALAADRSRIIGGAQFANAGWDPDSQTVTLSDAQPVSVGIQLGDDEVDRVVVRVVQADTDRTLAETDPIPVRITR